MDYSLGINGRVGAVFMELKRILLIHLTLRIKAKSSGASRT
jgi:hypothetical protein